MGLQAGAAALGYCSQMDALMPPPPVRARAAAAKRGASVPAESTLSNGSGGSHSRGSKRPTLTDDGAASGGSGQARPTRRSGRRGAELPTVSVVCACWSQA